MFNQSSFYLKILFYHSSLYFNNGIYFHFSPGGKVRGKCPRPIYIMCVCLLACACCCEYLVTTILVSVYRESRSWSKLAKWDANCSAWVSFLNKVHLSFLIFKTYLDTSFDPLLSLVTTVLVSLFRYSESRGDIPNF